MKRLTKRNAVWAMIPPQLSTFPTLQQRYEELMKELDVDLTADEVAAQGGQKK